VGKIVPLPACRILWDSACLYAFSKSELVLPVDDFPSAEPRLCLYAARLKSPALIGMVL
jgi:hypothetical protein